MHYFSYPSQSELHFLHHTWSSEVILFHTPLNQNCTFCITHGNLKEDFFTPLRDEMLGFGPNLRSPKWTDSWTAKMCDPSRLDIFSCAAREVRTTRFSGYITPARHYISF